MRRTCTQTLGLFALVALFTPQLGACSSDDSDETTGETGDETGDTAGDQCPHTLDENKEPAGASCTANEDCASDVCLLFSDAPPSENAVCGDLPANCGTHVTGTVQNIMNQAPLTGVEANLAFLGALDQVTSPGFAQTTTDAMGK